LAHIENIRNFGYDPVVAINVFLMIAKKNSSVFKSFSMKFM